MGNIFKNQLYGDLKPLDFNPENIFQNHSNWELLTDFETNVFSKLWTSGNVSYNKFIKWSGNKSLKLETGTDGSVVAETTNEKFIFNPQKNYFRLRINITNNPNNLTSIHRLLFVTHGNNFYKFNIPTEKLMQNQFVEIVCDRWETEGNPDPENITSFRIQFGADKGKKVKIFIDYLEILNPLFNNGVITLTFDDSKISHYSKIFDLMKIYGYKGVEGYCHSLSTMTDDQMKEMQDYGWDIVNHGWSHKGQKTYSESEVEYDILRMTLYLKENNFQGWNYFIAPGGQLVYYDLMSKYFIFSRGLGQTNGANSMPPVNQFLNCKTIISSTTVSEIKNIINDTIDRGEWLILLWHGLDGDGYEPWTATNFEEILQYISKCHTPVITFSDAWNIISGDYESVTI
jgi:peptidoglycan/xylan/chitin deacetylase (PgdA/CDA1 family)